MQCSNESNTIPHRLQQDPVLWNRKVRFRVYHRTTIQRCSDWAFGIAWRIMIYKHKSREILLAGVRFIIIWERSRDISFGSREWIPWSFWSLYKSAILLLSGSKKDPHERMIGISTRLSTLSIVEKAYHQAIDSLFSKLVFDFACYSRVSKLYTLPIIFCWILYQPVVDGTLLYCRWDFDGMGQAMGSKE